jgi:hypothetical protein
MNATKSRKPVKPVSGTVRLLKPVGEINDRTAQIEIDGKPYYLERTGTGFRLVGWDERDKEVTVYDLPLTLDSCDCPDATYRSERPGGCKHRKALLALQAAGKLS